MTHAIHEVTGFEKVAPFTLRVSFEDGTAQVVDFRPVLAGEIFGPLADPEVFEPGQDRRGESDARLAERSRFRSGDAARLAGGRAATRRNGKGLGGGKSVGSRRTGSSEGPRRVRL